MEPKQTKLLKPRLNKTLMRVADDFLKRYLRHKYSPELSEKRLGAKARNALAEVFEEIKGRHGNLHGIALIGGLAKGHETESTDVDIALIGQKFSKEDHEAISSAIKEHLDSRGLKLCETHSGGGMGLDFELDALENYIRVGAYRPIAKPFEFVVAHRNDKITRIQKEIIERLSARKDAQKVWRNIQRAHDMHLAYDPGKFADLVYDHYLHRLPGGSRGRALERYSEATGALREYFSAHPALEKKKAKYGLPSLEVCEKRLSRGRPVFRVR
jgi:predicted nucleotidyltransferase